ncbi:hypothetical protein [Brucella sp.]|uniref:hypothetical protein n=1 Tax=Brucella sp. TaxID=52132 RepID=UPI0028ACD434|nr:hypothetical protein [Brucella sp.]
MSKPEFTPGPWESGTLSDYTGECFVFHGGQIVSIVLRAPSNGKGSTSHNAHLIAAAPKLYEVLGKFMDFKDSDYVPNNLFERARSVLAEARGENHPSGGDRHGE